MGFGCSLHKARHEKNAGIATYRMAVDKLDTSIQISEHIPCAPSISVTSASWPSGINHHSACMSRLEDIQPSAVCNLDVREDTKMGFWTRTVKVF
jgi:hypothetical protein